MHAGSVSARKNRDRIAAQNRQNFARTVDAMIWEQTVRNASPTPRWVRPAILIGGVAVSLAWIGAVAHGCGS